MLPTFTQFAATLDGFAPLLLRGVWVTLQLALLSLLLGLVFGLLGPAPSCPRSGPRASAHSSTPP